MHFRKFTFIIFTLFLSGCVSRYALPPNIPKATLTLSTNLNGVRVQVYDDDKCTKSPYGNRLAYFFLNVADPHSGIEKEIPANNEFIYTFAFSSGVAPVTNTSSCNITLGFVPKANERYKSDFEGKSKQCVASVFRVVNTDNGERLVQEETMRQIKPSCVNNLTD